MEVSTQPNSSHTGFAYHYGSYESGPSYSSSAGTYSAGCFEEEQYQFTDDQHMGFEDYASSTGGSSASSQFEVDPVSDESESEYSDEPMDESQCSEMRKLDQNDAFELAATTEMLRIRFPFQSITIRLADFCCLQEKDLLNDTIVDFYLNHIVEHMLPDDPSKRVTVLPSVFWHNLSILDAVHNDSEAMDASLTPRQRLDARFGDVLEFVEGFDLLDVDYIVIPVNEWEHWSLAVVCNPFTTRGRIVCFDSQLTDDHNNLQNFATLIDDFLKYAWMRWRGEECPVSHSCVIPSNLAQQSNNFDCGVYILEFARHFLMEPVKDLDNFDFAVTYSDFNVSSARMNMQRAVLSLCSNRSSWAPLIDLLNKARR